MIALERVSAGYGAAPVLRDVSCTLPKGQLISLVGPNGSGKSTLLRVLAGMLIPGAGRVVLEDTPLRELKPNMIARRIAFLAQERDTPDLTVAQLVLHGRFPHLQYPRRYGPRDLAIARAAMERMGLEAHSHCPLAKLSGGMRQKARIAMALAQDSDYILLDEPTTYLDIGHQLALMNLLRELAVSGKGILAVLHDLPLAFSASDQVLLLHEGSLVGKAAPDALSASGMVRDVFGVDLIPSAEGRYHYRY